MRADSAAQPRKLADAVAATDAARKQTAAAPSTLSLGFEAPTSLTALLADSVQRVAKEPADRPTLVHVWAAFPNYIDGTTLYTELNVDKGDTPESLLRRWSGYLTSDLDQTAKARPDAAKAVDAVRSQVTRGDFPIVGARYQGSAAAMSSVAHTPPTALYDANSASGSVSDGSSATPLFPPDAASLRAQKEACGS